VRIDARRHEADGSHVVMYSVASAGYFGTQGGSVVGRALTSPESCSVISHNGA